MKLLIEQKELEEVQLITEGEGNEKQYYIEGIYLQAEVQNRNKRIYPKSVMAEAVRRYTESHIETHRAMGELGHPDNPSLNLDRVSHRIVSLKEDGNNWIGKAKILDTPMGRIAKNLMEEGVKLGVSSRGLGTLKEGVVQRDFFLVTPADIVADPSAPDAFVTNLMENKEWVWENGQLVEREIEIKEAINKMSKSNNSEDKLERIFHYLLSNIHSKG